MADLCGVLLLCLPEDHHVVDVHQASLPAHAGQDDVQSALESCWRVSKAEGHALIAESAHVAGECGLDPIALCYWHLPIAPQRVQGCKQTRFP